MVKKIIFPTDFSKGSEVAIPYIKELAVLYGASVTVLHVIYDIARNSGWYVAQLNTDALYADLKSHAQRELDAIVEDLGKSGVAADAKLVIGNPFEDIVEHAEENGYDMIVMSTHGRRAFDRMIFGSTAMKVVKNAHCPVLIIREPEAVKK